MMPKKDSIDTAPIIERAPASPKGYKNGSSRMLIRPMVKSLEHVPVGGAVLVPDGISRVLACYVAIAMGAYFDWHFVSYTAGDGRVYIRRNA